MRPNKLVIGPFLMFLLSLEGCGGGGGTASAPPYVSANSVALEWSAPQTNADGSPLTDLAGYELYFGTSSGSYDRRIEVGDVQTFTVTGLPSGTYYFAIRAYDFSGNKSGYSNEMQAAIQ